MSALPQAYCIIDGRLTSAAEAMVSIQDRGFRYGDGLFETIAIDSGVPYQLDWHLRRLADGLAAIRIRCDLGNIRTLAAQLLKTNNVRQGLLRIQVTRGTGGRGYLPDADAHPTVTLETSPLPELPPQPVALWQSRWRKISPRALPVQYKLCQGLNSTLARMEAHDHGCFDSLLLNEQYQICESSAGNIFWLKGNMLYTPALDCGVLEGSTRAAITRVSPWPVQEVQADIEALVDADAVFITNVAWTALAVGQLLPQRWQWPSENATDRLRQLLAEDRGYSS